MGKLAETVRRFARQQSLPVANSANGWWRNYALPRERDYLNDVGDGGGSSLVVPGIDFIANGFVEAPVEVKEKRGDEMEVVEDFGMTELIRRPNPFYSGALLWMPTVANWVTDGNAYWVITEFSAAGRPAAMFFVPSWQMEPKGSADGRVFLTHYEYNVGGRKFDVDPQQVVHFRWGLDPQNPLKGYSRLKTVLRDIYSDEEAARFTAALLRNMGVPGIVLSPQGDGSLGYDEAQATKQDIIAKTTGDHRGEPLVMTTATQTEQYGFSPEQMDLSSLRSIPESRVSACLNIPAAVLGFLSGMEQTKVGATMREMREQGYETGVIPKMRLFSEDLHTQLLPHYTDNPERFEVGFKLTNVRVLQEDKNALHTRLREDVRAGVRTVRSFKLGVNENPEPGDDVYLRAFNVTEVGPDAEPVEPVNQPIPIAASRSFAIETKATAAQLAYLRQLDREGQRLTPGFARELVRAFEDLGARTEAAWSALPVRFSAEDDAIVASVMSLLFLDEWARTALEGLFSTHYLRAASATIDAMEVALGVATDIPDPVARAVVAAGGRRMGLMDLEAQTRSALFEALEQARSEGLGPIEAGRRIRRFVAAGRFVGMEAESAGSGVRYRAELIARTETLHAQRLSVLEAGRQAGFEMFLAFDNRTGFNDAECIARDGLAFTYDEALAATAGEHPNGTLSFAPVPSTAVAARQIKGKVTEIQHVEYDEATGRIKKAWKEDVGG